MKMVIFHSYVSLPEGINGGFWWIFDAIPMIFFDDVPIESSHQFELKRILNWTVPNKAIFWGHMPLHWS
jgi:hypothetical protein